ncbi:MAG TPA: hypothetical protein VGQ53_09435 [Chitinophagaceae bacterium]|jgi:mono/diheme cytochrome c family protein|nr:hypothetical protein [Chitinophagaceae bacterium]
MKNHKPFLAIIILTAVILMVILIYFSVNKKPVDQLAETEDLKGVNNDRFRVRRLTNIKYQRTAQRLKQGAYLTQGILQCFTCHSPRDWTAPGAPPFFGKQAMGGTVISEDSTRMIIAPNITPDKETGAGNWTDDMLGRAIREGVGHDGRALCWQMPYSYFKNLSDEDLASVIVYLRSLPAIHYVVPPTKITDAERSGTEKSLKPILQSVRSPDFSDPVQRGKYLVGLGMCVGCHTAGSEYNPGLFAGGNFAHAFGRKAFTANITPDPSGISYSPVGFIFVMRTGKGGTLSPIMPWGAFKNMNDEDLKSIYAYLKTIPSSQHYINNQQPFTYCAICGQEHGLGEKNKRNRPAGLKLNPDIYDSYTGSYYNVTWNLTRIISREGDKLMGREGDNGLKIELVPQSEQHFLAPGWVLAVTFMKDKNGHTTQLVEDSDEGGVFKKIK